MFKDDWYQLNGRINYVKPLMYSINYAKNNRAHTFFILFQIRTKEKNAKKEIFSC